MKISINETKNLLINALAKRGIKKTDAVVIADDYIEGELLGKLSHGLIAFPSLIDEINRIKSNGKIIKNNSNYALIDGQGYFEIHDKLHEQLKLL